MYYYTLNEYLKSTFGKKVYKLALKSGATCPNRDGTVGTKVCIFCSCNGSGSFAESVCESVTEQIENAKKRLKNKVNNQTKYIAYFQDYSATYAPLSHLEKIFYEAINHPDVAVLSVATRPDCLPDDVLDLLSKLNKIKPVWVELGFQTSNEHTAEYIRRGYENSVFANTVSKLKSLGIYTVAHIIIGLPFETDEIIYLTTKYVCNQNVDGIKFHLLHVLKGTDLEVDFSLNKFETLSLEKYSEILGECIKRTPKNIVIHRITGDGDKKELISPIWSGDKKRVLNYINNYFNEINLNQGELVIEKNG